MRWFAYFILGYVSLGFQTGLAPHLRVGNAMINLVLIAAVFIAANAPRHAALLGCFGLGVMQDLATLNAPGLFALSYGLTAIVVAGTHRAVSGGHPVTHFAFTLFGGVVTAFVLTLHGWIAPTGSPQPFWTWIASAFYSGLVAIPLLWGLSRVRRAFKFRNARGFSVRL